MGSHARPPEIWRRSGAEQDGIAFKCALLTTKQKINSTSHASHSTKDVFLDTKTVASISLCVLPTLFDELIHTRLVSRGRGVGNPNTYERGHTLVQPVESGWALFMGFHYATTRWTLAERSARRGEVSRAFCFWRRCHSRRTGIKCLRSNSGHMHSKKKICVSW